MMMSGPAPEFDGHRGLLVDVFPADEIDLDLDAGLLGEFCRIGAEHVLVGLHETHRPQHAQAWRLSRSAENLAPATSAALMFEAAVWAGAPVAASAAAETPNVSASRRVMSLVMVHSPLFMLFPALNRPVNHFRKRSHRL